MKKIAVATEESKVAQHFGRCPEYTIVEAEGKEIIEEEVVENPGHKPGFLPRYLNDLGVDVIIAGGMGRKAKDIFDEHSIKTVTGAKGTVDKTLEGYLAGELDPEADICDHDHDHRNC
ncbi:MAG: NifB/NifX family molybdenum-iron cluster-binding protein [Bacillota bacterium]